MADGIKIKIGLEGVPQVQAGANAAATSLDRVARSADKLSTTGGTGFDNIATSLGSLGRVAGALALGTVAREFVQAADSVTVLNNQLKLATGSTAAAASAYSELFGIAQRSRTSFTQLGSTYASIARATDGLGISQARLLKVTESIGNAMAISGGSAAGMQAALTQLGQGLASGTLRGDELNSVLEQTPRLARAIADGMGVTVGQLRALGQEGKITAETIITALESQSAVLTGEVQTSVVTVGQAWTVLGNSATKAIGAIDAATGSTSTIASAMTGLADVVDNVADRFTRARESGLGFFGSLAAAQAMALAEALGHVDQNAANVGKRLIEAEANLSRLQLAFNARGGMYLAQEVEKARELADELRRAKQAQDDLKAERSTSQSQQLGQASASIDALAAKGLQEQREAQEALTAIRAKALGIDKSYTDQLAKLYGYFNAGKLSQADYVEGVEKLIATTVKSTGASKKAGDEIARQVKAGKELVQQMELQAAGLSGGYLKDWEKLGAAYKAGAISIDQLEVAQRRLLEQQPAMQAAAKALAESAQAVANARNRESEQIDAYIDAQTKAREAALRGTQDTLAAAVAEYENQGRLRSEIAATTLARLEDQQTALRAGSEAYESLQKQINAQRELVGVLRKTEVRDANAKAAREAAEEWQRTSDQIGQSLSDALMDGGRSAAEYLKGYFRNLILRPIIQAIVDPVSGAIAAFVTGGASGGGGGAGVAAAGVNNASTLVNLYQAGTGYSSGVNALAGYLGAGTTAGASGVSLAYANAVGAAGGDSLGALIAANNSWGGVAAGNSLGAAAAGEGVAAGSGAAAGEAAGSAGASAGATAWSLYAAAFVAAWMGSRSAWEKGYNNENLNGAFRYSPESTFTDLLKIGGMSDRSANIWGGGAVYTQLFGRADPRVTDQGVRGTIGGGDFTGQAYADITAKGGWFRSDKNWTDTQAVPESIDMFLDDAATAILKEAKKYGEALGLPAEQLANISTEIRVSLGDDAEKNKAAIIEALGKYGDALMGGYEAAIKPLQRYGETVTQTIERVGSALLGVNDILEQLGADTLAASVAGGGAALDLAARFGGQDQLTSAASAFYDAFYSEQEKVELLGTRLAKTFSDLGLTMPSVAGGAEAARDAYRDLVTGQDLTTESGRAAFTALIALGGAFDQVAQSSENLRAGLETAIGNVLPKFQTPAGRTQGQYESIAAGLRTVGVNIDVGTLMGASKDDIEAFARAVVAVGTNSIEMKTAVVTAAGALADLKDSAAETAADLANQQAELDIELLRALGNESAATAMERQRELDALRLLNPALAQTKQFIYDAVDAANAAAKSQRLTDSVSGLAADFLSPAELTSYYADQISAILKKGGITVDPKDIPGSTKAGVRELFDAAIGVDAKQAVVDAAQVWLQMTAPIETAARALKTFQDGLQDFIGSLKSGDLSPLSQQDQLAAAQSQYESTLAKAQAGDETARSKLPDAARAYLDEGQGAYASGGAYTAIYNQVISDLEALALAGGTGAAAAALTQPAAGAPAFIDGPAGSSGGLSGAPQPEPLTPPALIDGFSSAAADRQIAKLEAKLDAMLAELRSRGIQLDALITVNQIGHAGNIAATESLREPLQESAIQARLTTIENT